MLDRTQLSRPVIYREIQCLQGNSVCSNLAPVQNEPWIRPCKVSSYLLMLFCMYLLGWAKSPRILPPFLPRFLRFFGDFPPKNPQRLSLPHPQSIPKPFRGSIPVPIPVFFGFSGIEPQKNSKSNPSPSPKNPQNFSKPCPRPRSVPKIWGWGRGNSGIPPYYSHI